MIALTDILRGLKAHPDASRPAGDADPSRENGFQDFTVFESGTCSALYHWGRRSFADLAEVESWLAGEIPRSWEL